MRDIYKMVGHTPLIKIGTYKQTTLWAKLEGSNPTGSLKDRTASAIVSSVIDNSSKKELLDASSGSFACALSYYGRVAGLKVTVVVNSKISTDNLSFLKTQNANIIQFGSVTAESREHCLSLQQKEPDRWFFTDQLTNPIASKIHETTTAVEIFNELPNVSAIIASKGSGATLCGISKYLSKNKKEQVLLFGSVGIPGDIAKIAGTYVEGADFISPFISELEKTQFYTDDVPVTYTDAMTECLTLPVLVGPQGGGVYVAAKYAIDKNNITGNVVMIMGDTILKNVSRYSIK